MLLVWFATAIVVSGHLTIAGQLVSEAGRAHGGKALAMASGAAITGYLVLPAASLVVVREISWLVIGGIALLSGLGLPAILRVRQVHGRPIWPHLRNGLRAAFKESRWAWIVNGVLSLALVIAEVLVVPVYEKMFKDFGGMLPGPTLFVIDDSNWLKSNFIFLPVLLAMLHAFYVWWDALVQAGARRGSVIGWFRAVFWVSVGAYPAFAVFALYLPIFSLAGAIK